MRQYGTPPQPQPQMPMPVMGAAPSQVGAMMPPPAQGGLANFSPQYRYGGLAALAAGGTMPKTKVEQYNQYYNRYSAGGSPASSYNRRYNNQNANGYFKITDRAKDVIKIAGEWVSSLELEDLIAQHATVREVAVIGMPDDKWGERPLALVVPGESEPNEKELVSFVKTFVDSGRLTRHAMMLKVLVVDEIEKTSVGKIDKKLLRKKHL